MKKLYYTLFILSSLIIGTAADSYDSTVGIVTGEVEKGGLLGTIGIQYVLVQDRTTLEYAITNWSGRFEFRHENMEPYSNYDCTLYFSKDGYYEFSRSLIIQGGTGLDLGKLIMIEISE